MEKKFSDEQIEFAKSLNTYKTGQVLKTSKVAVMVRFPKMGMDEIEQLLRITHPVIRSV